MSKFTRKLRDVFNDFSDYAFCKGGIYDAPDDPRWHLSIDLKIAGMSAGIGGLSTALVEGIVVVTGLVTIPLGVGIPIIAGGAIVAGVIAAHKLNKLGDLNS